MNNFTSVFTNLHTAGGRLGYLAVAGGRIVAIGQSGEAPPPTGTTIDLGGRLVVPGFVEGHCHLDFSFYGGAWQPYRSGPDGFVVRERVAFQRDNFARAEPVSVRARRHVELSLGHGATSMRCHVMVDNELGLSHLEALLEVREAYRDRIDIEFVAFPQSGILTNPGTDKLLDEAVQRGCTLIGGLDPASFDRDVEKHLDVVFGIAERRGVGVDIHLHDGGTLGIFEIEQIASRTAALGMAGHVAVSHAYALGQVPESLLRRTADRLAEAGVAIMTIAPHDISFPPVGPLRAAGVTVFSGSDNIRDSWWPYGDGDMLRRANSIGHRSSFFTDAQLADALDVVTYAGARALRLEGYGLGVGDRADFVALPAAHVPEAVVAVPAERSVYKAGVLVAENGVVLNSLVQPKSA